MNDLNCIDVNTLSVHQVEFYFPVKYFLYLDTFPDECEFIIQMNRRAVATGNKTC